MPVDEFAARDLTARLAHEARLACRYLVRQECPPEMVARYVAAHRSLTAEPHEAVARFAFDHPWSMPLLDSASGLMKGGEGLRRKLYLMSAILEASPRFTSDFLPMSSSRSGLAFSLARFGLGAILKAALGLPLLGILSRPAR